MGCANSSEKRSESSSEKKVGVKVFGMPVSQNVMGPVLLAMDSGEGEMEMCNIMEGEQNKPEFLAMNPFHHIPTMKDGSVAIGESNAILRYIAMKYKPQYYPVWDPALCAMIDFAMDSFSNEVYKAHHDTIYVVFEFAKAPADQAAANKTYTEKLDTWVAHFLKGKFVGGNELTIADFKAVPLLIAAMQPAVEAKIGLTVSDRVKQYVKDFCDVVPSSSMLSQANGYSIVEYLASKAPDAKATATEYKTAEYAVAPKLESAGKIQVFGMPVSQNVMGPVLLAMDSGKGEMEMCNIMEGEQNKPEFLAMNPFHHIPTMKDGSVAIGESNAILRYIAMKYKPQYYPVWDPALCAMIDFAMDSFSNEVYKAHHDTIYVVFEFAKAPADQAAANKTYTEKLDTWVAHFLKGKFVGGNELTIADFKAVPLLIAAMQPAVEAKIGLTVSDRVKQYVKDFCDVVPSSSMLSQANGYSIVEYLASKAPDAKATATEYKTAEYAVAPKLESAGKIQVFGMPVSQNVMGPVLLAMDSGKGEMEMCNIMEGEQNKPEFLAMNPFHHIPTMKDGSVAIGESNAILRYIAMKYKPQYYPVWDPALCAMIDFAMDSFSNEVYKAHHDTIYVVFEFAKAPADQAAANKTYTEKLDT
eukprot:CAMPEP_0115204178 /NCGR_PEP_ID=MMETSP0270-20121206/19027_1 /TAXON_ID=71861 /ORGANISM="Scrippsiella trochoidea, Strain CCMP3099" /LENGTH=640 /DNA_ID=CAMNT_0002617653 /DNA_START=56 /DNA_END=1974 /DNA_ORIENTATION=-